LEESQVKTELADLVFEHILNETVEIMEHVHLSRIKPNLYQNKSIYSCEEIPRLTIQYHHTSHHDLDNINQ
jgi:hypothetical protein